MNARKLLRGAGVIILRIALAAITIISLVLVIISDVYVFPAMNSAKLWWIARLCDALLALAAVAFVARLTWKRSQTTAKKVRRALSRTALLLGLAGVVPYWVLGIPLMVVIYPPVAMLFASKEKEMYYGKCMEIRKGQTVAEVLATMAQFQISTQTSNALAFNTPEFSADVCYVRFTDEPVPRVKSVEFLVD